MTLPRTVAEVLADHVVFEIESIDRMYLNVYQPRLQYGGGVSAFFVGHRGNKYASSVLMQPITDNKNRISRSSGPNRDATSRTPTHDLTDL